jgi:hypothetical protein
MPCLSGCKTFACTSTSLSYIYSQQSYSQLVSYAATCDPSNTINVAAVKSKLISYYASGYCNQSAGITRVTDTPTITSAVSTAQQLTPSTPLNASAPPMEPPLTASTVTTAAAAGSVGGSLAGTLIAAALTWFFNTFGDTILDFMLGKVYSNFKSKVNAWLKARRDAAAKRANPDGKVLATGGAADLEEGKKATQSDSKPEIPAVLLEIMHQLKDEILQQLEAGAADTGSGTAQVPPSVSGRASPGKSPTRSSSRAPELTVELVAVGSWR